MHNKISSSWLLAVLATVSLTACSTRVNLRMPANSIENASKETADLADVTADALALAKIAGPENVLMVFDIDNTLLAMEQDLGADQWYEWQADLSKHDRCNPEHVGNRFAVQGALFFASAMRPTQPDAARQVQVIQDSGILVIAVSSRGPDYRLQTFRELRRNGIDFSDSAIGPPGGYGKLFMPVENGRFSRYEDGVFMTAGQHKGQMLNVLLQKTGTALPAVIIIVDDKQKNLDAVKETFSALGVPVRAWRYSGEDKNFADFDPAQAAAEWQSIEDALRQIQQVFGPDNYDLSSAIKPNECM